MDRKELIEILEKDLESIVENRRKAIGDKRSAGTIMEYTSLIRQNYGLINELKEKDND